LGLASHKELKEIEERMTKERQSFQNEIQKLFQEQKSSQERAMEGLKFAFEQSVNHLEIKGEVEMDRLLEHVSDMREDMSIKLLELNEHGKEITSKVDTLQEIVKIHWASTLIDYVEEILDEVSENAQPANGNELIHPLKYEFGEISELFHFIFRETKNAGFWIGWRKTKQTLQIYFTDKDEESGRNQVGAIQYEGSNDFHKKAPDTISWRFNKKNLPKSLLSNIFMIHSKEIYENDDYIIYKYKSDTANARTEIKAISKALRKSLLLIR